MEDLISAGRSVINGNNRSYYSGSRIIILLLTEEVSVHQLPDQLILLLDKVFAVQVVQVQIAEL